MTPARVAIIGAGFGLYGYVPALAGLCGARVVLPLRCRDRFAARPELQRFAGAIDWAADAAEALAASDGAALAVPPEAQPALIAHCLALPHMRRLYLEKPLAADPVLAGLTHETLVRSGVDFSMGYIFRHTRWGRALRAACPALSPAAVLTIEWRFLAHHYGMAIDTWKRDRRRGGGALRFYGIQVLALAAELGYARVTLSRAAASRAGEMEVWQAVLAGDGLPRCEVTLDCRAAVTSFTVRAGESAVFADLAGPFAEEVAPASWPGIDNRALLLAQNVAASDGVAHHGWYGRAIDLWGQAERGISAAGGAR